MQGNGNVLTFGRSRTARFTGFQIADDDSGNRVLTVFLEAVPDDGHFIGHVTTDCQSVEAFKEIDFCRNRSLFDKFNRRLRFGFR